ncbi:class I SAM-dependent methyltransferase [Nitratireductor sp. XY-223]|uniref:class I SAM-dependent methyltransferase n=1 Tax=Nitratireductor sp. XY-223 TaxID=2561926 RepID=UPI0010A9EAEA|nr:class I SAM-dependent methyltransferase [Nitratireductor sp. XY-223]
MTKPMTQVFPVATTYNHAADTFDAAPLGFWERHGKKAVELARLRHGESVLDIGCGTGASAFPASQAVGPTGKVTGVDFAEKMIDVARRKADEGRRRNVEFRCLDMRSMPFRERSFDAVISVFSVFFVDDMEKLVADLWSLLKPGGRLVVTVWGPHAFEPGGPVFFEELERLGGSAPRGPVPWARLTTPDGLADLLVGGGAADPEITSAEDYQALIEPGDFWTLVMGSGFRGEVENLDPFAQRKLRKSVTGRVAAKGFSSIATHAIHAVSSKRH